MEVGSPMTIRVNNDVTLGLTNDQCQPQGDIIIDPKWKRQNVRGDDCDSSGKFANVPYFTVANLNLRLVHCSHQSRPGPLTDTL